MSLSYGLIESEVTLFLEENGYFFSFVSFGKKGHIHTICFEKFGRGKNRFAFYFWIGEKYIPVIMNKTKIKTIKNLKLILGFLIESITMIENNILNTSYNPDDFVFEHTEIVTTDYDMFFVPVFFTVSLYEEKHKFNEKYSIVNRLDFKNKHSGNLALVLDNKDILVTNIYE